MNLIKENINNLTSFWSTAAAQFQGTTEKEHYSSAIIPNSDWPNRVWLKSDITPNLFQEVRAESIQQETPLLFSDFAPQSPQRKELFEAEGYRLIFEQIGMSLQLTDRFATSELLQLQPVTTVEQANTWSSVFKQSFGYTIPAHAVVNHSSLTTFYLAYHQQAVVSTVAIHQTGKTMGIHSVGTPPEHRRKGYAEQVMRATLNIAMTKGCELAVLQASALGKGIYSRLGFGEQFTMYNYGQAVFFDKVIKSDKLS